MFIFKAFRAIDNEDLCLEFLEGHRNVLKEYGVTKVTSARRDWISNPNVYVIVVIDAEEKRVVSGMRLHLAHEDYPLPMETAIAEVDKSIHCVVAKYRENVTGEIGGLWNSRSIAGYGIGIKFLIRCGIVLAEQLKMGTLLALCAEHTLGSCLEKGFEIEEGVGNSGKFNYPKIDLVATAAVIKDLVNLPLALEEEREEVFKLRRELNCESVYSTARGEMHIKYELEL
ncbi:hypothetical protein [Echinicola shivajiensis]|uniref:hypothetical protein n=1 Tax=Echinicola shivajiensis TaxID=1035916 RepID=UPI001BFC50EA|nr:hypothetical protein [Echinicola shivajiensis]